MQLRPDQLEASLARGLRPVYTVHGDEALLAQEAADTVRDAARAAGHVERKVFVVSGAHFDWSAVLGAAQALSLFAERQLIEIRIPSGKPGKDGAQALQRYCEQLSPEVLTLLHLPRLDFQQSKAAWFAALDAAGVVLRVEPLARSALPQWLAQRLARQGQRVQEGQAGQQTLAWLADRVEGNLLAAHQEVQKLALLYPAGEITLEQLRVAVTNVARYDVDKLSQSVWTGQVARALRVLEGLQAEGESAVRVHWALAEDVRALARARQALDEGRPLPLALKEARAWGGKEKLYERVLPQLSAAPLARLLLAGNVCDGVIKGLPHPQWPLRDWPALRRWVLMMLQFAGAAPRLVLAA